MRQVTTNDVRQKAHILTEIVFQLLLEPRAQRTIVAGDVEAVGQGIDAKAARQVKAPRRRQACRSDVYNTTERQFLPELMRSNVTSDTGASSSYSSKAL